MIDITNPTPHIFELATVIATTVPEPVRTLADIIAQFAGVAAARLIAGF